MEQVGQALVQLAEVVLVFPLIAFVGPLVDDAALMLAYFFVSHGCDESLLERVRTPDIERLCIDGNGLGHNDCSRNEERDTFDFYTPRCASITVSFQHNEV